MGLRIIALLIAIVLWVHTSGESIHELTTEIPIHYRNLPSDLSFAGDVPETINVTIHAPGFDLLQLRATDFYGLYAELDLKAVQPGKETFNLNTENIHLPEELRIQSIEIRSYKRLTLQIDPLIEKTLTVIPAVAIKPKNGHILVDNLQIDPPQVTARGPQSTLREMTSIKTEKIQIREADRTISQQVPLQIPPNSHLSCKPSHVTIEQRVEAFSRQRFMGVPVKLINVRNGYNARTDPETATVLISGIASIVDSLTLNDLACTIDARWRREGEFTLPVKVRYPESPYISLDLVIPEEFTLIITRN